MGGRLAWIESVARAQRRTTAISAIFAARLASWSSKVAKRPAGRIFSEGLVVSPTGFEPGKDREKP
jgi:hypothetical protein